MDNKPNLSKDLILETSAKLFRVRSYPEVSMRGIAKTLNVKASSLYNHINSKQEILELIIFSLVDVFVETINYTKSKNIDVEEKLFEIIRTHIKIALHHPNAFATLNNEWKHLNLEKKQTFLKERENYESTLKKIIVEGQKNNTIYEGNADIIIYMILTSLRTLHLWYERKKLDEDTLMNEIPKLILKGVMT